MAQGVSHDRRLLLDRRRRVSAAAVLFKMQCGKRRCPVRNQPEHPSCGHDGRCHTRGVWVPADRHHLRRLYELGLFQAQLAHIQMDCHHRGHSVRHVLPRPVGNRHDGNLGETGPVRAERSFLSVQPENEPGFRCAAMPGTHDHRIHIDIQALEKEEINPNADTGVSSFEKPLSQE